MTLKQGWTTASVVALAIAVAGCSGGAAVGDSLVTTPPSPPPPPPPPSGVQGITIFPAPATQEFAAFSVGDPLRIRYDAGTGQYEVMTPGRGWEGLIDDPQSSIPNALLFASAPNQGSGHFSARTAYNNPAPELRYQYSSLASWRMGATGSAVPLGGSIAFGMATPTGGVPVAGSASYQGQIEGTASFAATSGWGDFTNAPVGGSVRLDFDFGRGLLAGQIRPTLACDCDPITFPTLDFVDTVFGVGSQTFSGRFNTTVSGGNTFSGRFTGPNAQELIGRWTFPMTFGGSPHTVSGVWIAKNGN